LKLFGGFPVVTDSDKIGLFMKQSLRALPLPNPEARTRYLVMALVALALASILLAMPLYA
jgi:hypothetical protein